MRFGTATIADMTWKQMIDTMSCTECGRCQDVCPAYATGKELSPKLLIMGLRDQLFAEGPQALAASRGGEAFEPTAARRRTPSRDDVVWDCVTCGACVRECPVAIEHVDHIVDLRRSLVMVESRFPAEARDDAARRRALAEPVGQASRPSAPTGPRGSTCGSCSPASRRPRFSTGSAAPPRSTSAPATTARSTATLLKAAGLDFAILGPRECCTGDPARRMGNEYTFQSYAEQNVATLERGAA